MQKIHLPGNITSSQKVDFLLLIEQFLHLVDEGLSLVVLLAVVVAVELAEQLALLFGQAARRFHAHLENQIALVVRPKLLDALAADAEFSVRLRAFGDGVLHAAIERRDVNFRAERRLREGNRHFEAQICALAAE